MTRRHPLTDATFEIAAIIKPWLNAIPNLNWTLTQVDARHYTIRYIYDDHKSKILAKNRITFAWAVMQPYPEMFKTRVLDGAADAYRGYLYELIRQLEENDKPLHPDAVNIEESLKEWMNDY